MVVEAGQYSDRGRGGPQAASRDVPVVLAVNKIRSADRSGADAAVPRRSCRRSGRSPRSCRSARRSGSNLPRTAAKAHRRAPARAAADVRAGRAHRPERTLPRGGTGARKAVPAARRRAALRLRRRDREVRGGGPAAAHPRGDRGREGRPQGDRHRRGRREAEADRDRARARTWRGCSAARCTWRSGSRCSGGWTERRARWCKRLGYEPDDGMEPQDASTTTPAYVLHVLCLRETSLIVEVFARAHRPRRAGRARRPPAALGRCAACCSRSSRCGWPGPAAGRCARCSAPSGRAGSRCCRARRCCAASTSTNCCCACCRAKTRTRRCSSDYAAALARACPRRGDPAPVLRAFEKPPAARNSGYALSLDRDGASGAAIEPEALYLTNPSAGRCGSTRRRHRRRSGVQRPRRCSTSRADDYSDPRTLAAGEAADAHADQPPAGPPAAQQPRAIFRSCRTCDRTRRQHRPRRHAAPGAPHVRARPGVGRRRGASRRRRRHHRASARGPPPHPGRGRAPPARAHAHQAQPRNGRDRGDGRHRIAHPARDGHAGARGAPRDHHRRRPRHRAQEAKITAAVSRLRDAGIVVSVFIDADPAQVEAAKRIGASVCEIHTGPYAHAFHSQGRDAESPAVVARDRAHRERPASDPRARHAVQRRACAELLQRAADRPPGRRARTPHRPCDRQPRRVRRHARGGARDEAA